MTQKSRNTAGHEPHGLETDTLYAVPHGAEGPFRFDERVARVFADMIDRSVPGYALVVSLTGLLARHYAQDHSTIYDLGCSLGASTLAMRQAVRAEGVRFIAVDTSAAMVARCREAVAADAAAAPVEVRQADVLDLAIENASVVTMNFTLQFIDRGERQGLVNRIAEGLRPGGVLLLSEKVAFPDPVTQDLQSSWHHDYKRARGYSELEIAAKRTALENVLVMETDTTHRERLTAAGFRRVDRWFQCFGFCSYLASR